jgi:hypothetical protein
MGLSVRGLLSQVNARAENTDKFSDKLRADSS